MGNRLERPIFDLKDFHLTWLDNDEGGGLSILGDEPVSADFRAIVMQLILAGFFRVERGDE